MDEKQTRDYTLFLHLSGLSILLSIPGFIGPLVMWLVKKDESAFVDRHGKAAVNFHISLMLYAFVFIVFGFFLAIVTLGLGLLLLIPIILGLLVVGILFPVLAALKAQKGEEYAYPLAIPFLR